MKDYGKRIASKRIKNWITLKVASVARIKRELINLRTDSPKRKWNAVIAMDLGLIQYYSSKRGWALLMRINILIKH